MLVIPRTITMRRGLRVGTVVLHQQVFRIIAATAGVDSELHTPSHVLKKLQSVFRHGLAIVVEW